MIHRKNHGFWPETYYGLFSKQAKKRQGGKQNSSQKEMKRSLIIPEITKGRHRRSMPEDAKIASKLHYQGKSQRMLKDGRLNETKSPEFLKLISDESLTGK